MADIFSKEKRSQIMSQIKSNKTLPELKILPFLVKIGFDYQPKLPGNPDFAHWRKKVVVFIDGCFWHCCPIHSKIPKQNKDYWLPKLRRNMIRAKEINLAYQNSGWKVIRIWEHTINNSL